MAFLETNNSLIRTVHGACSNGKHLSHVNGQWQITNTKPANAWAETLKFLTKSVKEMTFLPQETDQLVQDVRVLHEKEKTQGITSIFDGHVKKEESLAYSKLAEAIAEHQRLNSKLKLDLFIESLGNYVAKSDIMGFANLYSETFNRNDEDRAKIFEAVKNMAEKNPKNTWLQRCVKEPEWLPTLAVSPDTQPYLRTLDLKGITDYISVKKVVDAHANFTELMLILELNHLCVLDLMRDNVFEKAVSLDFRNCIDMDWPSLQNELLRLKKLNNFIMPDWAGYLSLENISSKWSSTMRKVVEQNVINALARQKVNKHDALERDNGSYSQWVSVANIIRGSKEPYQLSLAAGFILNAILQSEDAAKTLNFSGCNFVGLSQINDALLQKLNFPNGAGKISLAYCPNFTKEGFKFIYEKCNPLGVSVEGCRHVDDSFFEDHPLLVPSDKYKGHSLNLKGTSVTPSIVDALQKANPEMTIEYDPMYLIRAVHVKRKQQISIEDLSRDARNALIEFEITGYFPQINVNAAMEILIKPTYLRPDLTKEIRKYCVFYLSNNLSQNNVFEIYNFAKDNQLELLMYRARNFINIFCHPDIPQFWNRLDKTQQTLARSIFNDAIPNDNDEYVEFIEPRPVEDQKVLDVSGDLSRFITNEDL